MFLFRVGKQKRSFTKDPLSPLSQTNLQLNATTCYKIFPRKPFCGGENVRQGEVHSQKSLNVLFLNLPQNLHAPCFPKPYNVIENVWGCQAFFPSWIKEAPKISRISQLSFANWKDLLVDNDIHWLGSRVWWFHQFGNGKEGKERKKYRRLFCSTDIRSHTRASLVLGLRNCTWLYFFALTSY